jgi:16S rRNA (cytosine967-C5)-methyltransferase
MGSPRLEAVRTLRRVLRDGAYSSIELMHTDGLSGADRALYAAIVRTVLERKLTLDCVLSKYVRKKPEPELVCALYAGLAQILYMQKIPPSAACDETVKAAKELTDERRAGFVNAVLRSVCREKDEVLEYISEAPEHIRYSLSQDICAMLRKQYPDEAGYALGCVFSRPELCLRVNTLRTTAEELASRLAQNGAECIPNGDSVTVTSSGDRIIEGIGGDYFVQGANSQFAVSLLGAEPGMNVIDVCACPGGKALGAALDMKNTGAITAFDIHKNKLSLIVSSAQKLGIDIISAYERDSRVPDPALAQSADRVICDVPCSSLGVLASKPEIRYKEISTLAPLYQTQAQILSASAAYLRAGGRMVYSTCTFNKDENDHQVEAFIRQNDGFRLISEHTFLAENGRFDAFYAALIERIR